MDRISVRFKASNLLKGTPRSRAKKACIRCHHGKKKVFDFSPSPPPRLTSSFQCEQKTPGTRCNRCRHSGVDCRYGIPASVPASAFPLPPTFADATGTLPPSPASCENSSTAFQRVHISGTASQPQYAPAFCSNYVTHTPSAFEAVSGAEAAQTSWSDGFTFNATIAGQPLAMPTSYDVVTYQPTWNRAQLDQLEVSAISRTTTQTQNYHIGLLPPASSRTRVLDGAFIHLAHCEPGESFFSSLDGGFLDVFPDLPPEQHPGQAYSEESSPVRPSSI
jgi:hypothetical protein